MQGVYTHEDSVAAVYGQVGTVQALDLALYTQFTLFAST
jgi:hypothetical protein